MKKLIKGIVDFRRNVLPDYEAKFARLAYKQSPDTLFIGCCDSRVVPNTFASTDPGDLFVLRNIGNLVPPYHAPNPDHEIDDSVAATIEFSILNLNVSDIIVCGHSDCAAMNSFMAKNANESRPYLMNWLKNAIPSYERYLKHPIAKKDLSPHNALSQTNVIQQIEHLKTYPWVHDRIATGSLKLHGWWFDVATANVHYYDKNKKEFVLIDDDEAENIFATI